MTSTGTPRVVVQKILNHVETGVTAVYDRYSYDNERSSIRSPRTVATYRHVERTASTCSAG
jgi:hypothetical protein